MMNPGGVYRDPTPKEIQTQPWNHGAGACFYARAVIQDAAGRRLETSIQVRAGAWPKVILTPIGSLVIWSGGRRVLHLRKDQWSYCRIGATVDDMRQFWTLRPEMAS